MAVYSDGDEDTLEKRRLSQNYLAAAVILQIFWVFASDVKVQQSPAVSSQEYPGATSQSAAPFFCLFCKFIAHCRRIYHNLGLEIFV